MWNDEDNNPYGTSFDRSDPLSSSTQSATSPGGRECEWPDDIFHCQAQSEFFDLRMRGRHGPLAVAGTMLM